MLWLVICCDYSPLKIRHFRPANYEMFPGEHALGPPSLAPCVGEFLALPLPFMRKN